MLFVCLAFRPSETLNAGQDIRDLNAPRQSANKGTYYVAIEGNDTYPGTFERPFRTLEMTIHIFCCIFSGGKVRYGRLRPDTNHYLKWAFSEAGNLVALNHNRFPARYVSQLYNRIRGRKGHVKAVGAVARHLAEATYWILTKNEVYRDKV